MFTFTRSSVLKTLFFSTIIGIVLGVSACSGISSPVEPTPVLNFDPRKVTIRYSWMDAPPEAYTSLLGGSLNIVPGYPQPAWDKIQTYSVGLGNADWNVQSQTLTAVADVFTNVQYLVFVSDGRRFKFQGLVNYGETLMTDIEGKLLVTTDCGRLMNPETPSTCAVMKKIQ